MIRFRLTELLADRSFKEGRRIEWQEVAEGAGIHRTTLSRLLNVRGYNASVSTLDSVCRYFNCKLGELAEYVPDSEVEGPVEKSYRGPKPAVARVSEKRATAKRTTKKDKTV